MKHLLKFLKEALMPSQQVNIMVGRFQPLTEGHMKCVEQAWKERGVPTVLLMIETTEAKVNDKHPFPSSYTLPLYKQILKSNKHVADVVLTKNANIVTNKELLKGYEIVSWTCGTDRLDAYKKMTEKYAPEIEVIEIKRGDEDISATKVRNAIRDDDYGTFKKLVPIPNEKTFREMQEYLTKAESK